MIQDKLIKIGTIESEHALWQASRVRAAIAELGYRTAIIPLPPSGDDVDNLNAALLSQTIDIGVYSMIDVPLCLQDGIVQAAVLERNEPYEVLLYKEADQVMTKYEGHVAANTSLRKAQWLNRYAKHSVDRTGGPIETQLQALKDSEWNGAVFSGSLLGDLDKLSENHLRLDWMLPAPAQDAIVACTRAEDTDCLEICADVNHEESELCTHIERDFMRALDGDYLAPIGALAEVSKNWRGVSQIELRGVLLSLDGQEKIEVNKSAKLSEAHMLGHDCAQDVIVDGGKAILDMVAIQTTKERKRRKPVPANKDVKTRAKTGAKKSPLPSGASVQTQKKSAPSPTDLISLVSTQKLADEHLAMLRKRYRVENLDFIQTVYSTIPPEAVRTDSMIIASTASVDSLLASFPRLNLRFKNIYCVGEKTRRLVEERLGRVLYTADTPRELAIYLCQNMSGRAITYFCSTLRRDDLPDLLAKHNIKVTEVPAYEMRNASHEIKRSVDGVLFFNPAGVRSYIQNNSTEVPVFCMGEITAVEANKHFENVQSTKLASTEHMLQLVNKHFA